MTTQSWQTQDLTPFLRTAVEAAKMAGKIQRANYGKVLDIQFKSKNRINLVTEVDQECERRVMAYLKKKYPRFNLWGEETGQKQKKSEYTWLLDPLDGTTNYAHAYPFFCCSIALLKHGRPIVGVVYDPMRNELFTAVHGKGSFLNGKRLRVSSVPKLHDSLLVTGFSYLVRETQYNLDNFKRFVMTAQGVRRDGSAALNLCYVAAGRFDGFWERGIQAWDMAAGMLNIVEAGGLVTDVTGKPWDLLGQNALASNGMIHQEMLGILKGGIDEKNWQKQHKISQKKEAPKEVQLVATTMDLPLFSQKQTKKKK